MDPILEEMKRSREMRPDRFRTCVDYLCALVAAKDDKIAALEAENAGLKGRGSVGRPRKDAEAAHV